jgi:hypothetical protein
MDSSNEIFYEHFIDTSDGPFDDDIEIIVTVVALVHRDILHIYAGVLTVETSDEVCFYPSWVAS